MYNYLKRNLPVELKKTIKTPVEYFFKFLVYIESIVLTPFLFLKNKQTFANKIIFPFYHHSFGHTITGIDCIARLFYPEKLTLIIVPHPNTNKYLIKCFSNSYDIFYFNYFFNFNYIINSSTIRYKVVKMYLNIIVIFKSNYQIINTFERFYGIMSKTPATCFAGDEKNDKKIPYINISGYGSLLENKIGIQPKLPDSDIQFCIEKIRKYYPTFFEKPFITLLLRSKAANSIDFSNSVRNTNQKNYISSVQYAINNGYNIVSSGDTNSKIFENLEGFYDLSNIGIPSQLLNIFLITNCKYFIGQQSGPYALANSSGINCLLIDCWPYRIGSFLKNDLNLYKQIFIEGEGYINLKRLFSEHQDLCLGYGYKRKKVQVIDNTEDEIFKSFQEFIRKDEFLETENLKNLLEIVPVYMPFKYAPSRPPSFILKNLSNL